MVTSSAPHLFLQSKTKDCARPKKITFIHTYLYTQKKIHKGDWMNIIDLKVQAWATSVETSEFGSEILL